MLTFIIMCSSVLFLFTASASDENLGETGGSLGEIISFPVVYENGDTSLLYSCNYSKNEILSAINSYDPDVLLCNYGVFLGTYDGNRFYAVVYNFSSNSEDDKFISDLSDLSASNPGVVHFYRFDNASVNFSRHSQNNVSYSIISSINHEAFLNGLRLLDSNVPVDLNGIDVSDSPIVPTPFEASVIGDGSTIKYNVEFLSKGNYEVNFMACTGENGENKIDYSGFSEKSGTYYYDGKSDDPSAGNGDDLGLAGGSAIDSIIAGINGEKVSTKSVYYELDLQDFYDKVQDKQNFKNAEMIYYTIEIKDLDNNNVKYFSYQLEPNTLADSVKENDSGLFSTRKDYIGFPPISDYIDTDFPDIADYVNFDMFRNMDFVDVGGLDSVLDILKNVWIVIKTIFSFLIGNVLDFFVWLWAVLKYIFFNLLGMIKWLGACLWTIVQNIGVALYNLVVDIRRLLSWLFVPGSSFFNTYLADFKKTLYNKFGIVGEIKLFFETIIDNLSGNAEAPVWKFTIFGKECNFIDFSAFDNYQSLIHSVILAIAWVKFLKKIIVSIPSIISGSNVEILDNSPTAIPMQSTEIRPL